MAVSDKKHIKIHILNLPIGSSKMKWHCRYCPSKHPWHYLPNFTSNCFEIPLLASRLGLWSKLYLAKTMTLFLSLTLCSLSPSLFSCHPVFCLCSKRCRPPRFRVEWSPFCCQSCALSWSCILAGGGVNAAASLSLRRVPALRQPMRFTISHRCWWEVRPAKA